jgi:hypothetical protein
VEDISGQSLRPENSKPHDAKVVRPFLCTLTRLETGESLRVIRAFAPVRRQQLSPAHVLYGQSPSSPFAEFALGVQTGAVDIGPVQVAGYLVHLQQIVDDYEIIVAYFNVLLQHSHGEIAESDGTHQSLANEVQTGYL